MKKNIKTNGLTPSGIHVHVIRVAVIFVVEVHATAVDSAKALFMEMRPCPSMKSTIRGMLARGQGLIEVRKPSQMAETAARKYESINPVLKRI